MPCTHARFSIAHRAPVGVPIQCGTHAHVAQPPPKIFHAHEVFHCTCGTAALGCGFFPREVSLEEPDASLKDRASAEFWMKTKIEEEIIEKTKLPAQTQPLKILKKRINDRDTKRPK